MDCERGPITGYYYGPPMKNDPPAYTNQIRTSVKGHRWHNTHMAIMSRSDSRGYKYEWDLRPFPWSSFKQYVGNVTYRGEGFSCFLDDWHEVHVDKEFGQCHPAVYCTHNEGTIINFSASSDVVSWGSSTTGPMQPPNFQDPQGAVKKIMTKFKDAKTGPMTCDSSVIDIGGNCVLTVRCKSSDVTSRALDGLIDTMGDTYKNEERLYKPINSGSCGGSWGTTCHWFRGVSIPAHYSLATGNVAPPAGDGSLKPPAGSSLQTTLDVDLTCGLKDKDSALCGALCGALQFIFAAGGAAAACSVGAAAAAGGLGALIVATCA